jgi:hypothetical protein
MQIVKTTLEPDLERAPEGKLTRHVPSVIKRLKASGSNAVRIELRVVTRTKKILIAIVERVPAKSLDLVVHKFLAIVAVHPEFVGLGGDRPVGERRTTVDVDVVQRGVAEKSLPCSNAIPPA